MIFLVAFAVPSAGLTHRATIDPELNEIHVLTVSFWFATCKIFTYLFFTRDGLIEVYKILHGLENIESSSGKCKTTCTLSETVV